VNLRSSNAASTTLEASSTEILGDKIRVFCKRTSDGQSQYLYQDWSIADLTVDGVVQIAGALPTDISQPNTSEVTLGDGVKLSLAGDGMSFVGIPKEVAASTVESGIVISSVNPPSVIPQQLETASPAQSSALSSPHTQSAVNSTSQSSSSAANQASSKSPLVSASITIPQSSSALTVQPESPSPVLPPLTPQESSEKPSVNTAGIAAGAAVGGAFVAGIGAIIYNRRKNTGESDGAIQLQDMRSKKQLAEDFAQALNQNGVTDLILDFDGVVTKIDSWHGLGYQARSKTFVDCAKYHGPQTLEQRLILAGDGKISVTDKNSTMHGATLAMDELFADLELLEHILIACENKRTTCHLMTKQDAGIVAQIIDKVQVTTGGRTLKSFFKDIHSGNKVISVEMIMKDQPHGKAFCVDDDPNEVAQIKAQKYTPNDKAEQDAKYSALIYSGVKQYPQVYVGDESDAGMRGEHIREIISGTNVLQSKSLKISWQGTGQKGRGSEDV
jgi:hypothetical protein